MNSRERERESSDSRFLHRTLSKSERHRISGGMCSDIEGRRNTCCSGHIVYTGVIASLCARDYKGVGSQYVNENKLVIDIWN